MALVTSQRGHVVLTFGERFEANDALVHDASVAILEDLLVKQNTGHGLDQVMLHKLALSLPVGFLEDIVDVKRQHQ